MHTAQKSGSLFRQRGLAAVAILCILLVGYATVVAAWHHDEPGRDCPICQIANLPMVKPVAVAQVALPASVERHVPAVLSLQELEAALTFCSPRAPPA